MKYTIIIKTLIFIFFCFSVYSGNTQSYSIGRIGGSAGTANNGDRANYVVYKNGTIMSSGYMNDIEWRVSGGQIVGGTSSSSLTVLWNGDVRNCRINILFKDVQAGGYYSASLSVTVEGTSPDRPPYPKIQSRDCGEVIIAYEGTPLRGTNWYWQGKNPDGENTNLGYGKTFSASDGNGRYYLRAKNSFGWSKTSSYIDVEITDTPQIPDMPGINMINNGESVVLTKGTPPNGVEWYWQESENGESTDSSESSITLTTGTVYYIKARSISLNCWSAARRINYTLRNPDLDPYDVLETDRNWMSSVSYDITGVIKENSIRYANALGNTEQIQHVDIKTAKLWTTHTLYDKEGRATFQTTGAPLDALKSSTFQFRNDFIRKSNGSNYSTADFETNPENPAAVGNQPGTLGWYYSENNTSEPYQDITAYPFSRMIFSDLNPGAVLKHVGGNKVNGTWPQSYVFSMQTSGELAQSAAFGEGRYATVKTIKTVSRDVHGVENVIFTDTDGKTLAAARSGGGSARNMNIKIGAQGYVDIHVPAGTTGFTVNRPSGVQTSVYDLITENQVTTATTSLPNGFYRVAVTDVDNYNPATPVQVTYKENYYDYALNEYDKAGHLIASYQPYGNTKSVKPKTTFKYDALGQLIYTNSPDEGEAWFKYRRDGQIRYSQNSKQKAEGEFSYTNYDNLARPVESGVLVSTAFNNADPDASLPAGTKKEQQFTVYDAGESISVGSGARKQAFAAGNVARTYNDHTTTWYSYDIYGRVNWIVQDIPGIGKKTIDYEYHPVSGLVSQVVYQKDVGAERFIHRYTYDKTDRLIKVETSVNGSTYTTRATYSYYENGALKRTELGNKLQGLDYVYNISGQLKSINHPALSAAKDPGADGNDIFGMTLDYHRNDYMRNIDGLSPATYGNDRLDGNIKGVRWNNKYQPLTGAENAYNYTYDRNNWLAAATYGQYAESFGSDIEADITSAAVTGSGETLPLEATGSITLKPGFHAKAGSTFTARIVKVDGFAENAKGDYKVTLTYDANGNIQTLERNQNTVGSSNAMDKLTYNYSNSKPNRLDHVKDAVTAGTGADDIKGQASGNYVYNTIGQLTENKEENVKYRYTASGLVSEVLKNNVPLVKFFYNDRGHRVKKESYTSGSLAKTEYYVRDASGSVMAIYQGTSAKEYPIYGASRLGVYFKTGNTAVYQLTDHLGNVRALVQESGTLAGATDYYPGGMAMPARKLSDAEGYRYGYQGDFAETDEETGKPAFELRLYDPRINRWLTTDPAQQYDSPYLSMGNNWVNRRDIDGGEDSPIFDQDGNFLGVDDQGYQGQIIIMDRDRYGKLVANCGPGEIMSHETAMKNNLGLSSLGENFEAMSKIQTHVMNEKGFDINKFHNGMTSITSGFRRNGVLEGFNDPASAQRYKGTPLENGYVKVTTKASYFSELSTVELIVNYLGVHEFTGHGLNKWINGTDHYKAYELQKKHESFHNLPDWAKEEINNRIYDPRNRPDGYIPPRGWKRM
ncbi:RHS repeat-associated core domain-containing protein [Sinomicrobium oceani]|uniref:RHS repeat-associated core domain-containing protein n=2 Tax=Sinomicrobium oceani TaxID=1150368 RepID=A0A1K1R8J7_9FLAO|nr:RHS repeat-associated core domain-containing protein [Sinomicrobium oceani]